MHPVLFILSALPTTWAAHAYAVPQGLALQALDATSGCNLPDVYHIRNFRASSKNSGKTLSQLDFVFQDDDTKLTTPCHLNSTSKSIPGNGTPRYRCDNALVEFIWDDEDGKLWMMEQVCIQEDG